MWTDVFSAIALLLVAEGIMPFLNPAAMRRAMAAMMARDDRTLRVIGLSSMLAGVIILTAARY
ncbi:MAG: hypothetical protein ACI8PT_001159 [Gammaproteobacteria bacterium]|jgi:uncharacterized protein YjeT (DUF2065 family)